jgi:hypothetical protein
MTRALLVAGLPGCLAWAGLAMLGPLELRPALALAWYALAFAGYAAGCRLVLRSGARAGRWTVALILAVALIQRLLALPVPPSDDVHRYLWEARVLASGASPYRLSPDAPELAALAQDDPWHAGVNHPEWTAIYPPLAQLWHVGVITVSYTPLALKLSFLLAEAALAALLLQLLAARGLPASRVLIYLWNPLAVHTVAAQAHHDALAAALLVGALCLLLRGRAALAAGVAAAAALTKGFALAALPAFLGRRPGPWGLAALVFAATCAPFLIFGGGLSASLMRFGSELHTNDSLNAVARAALGAGPARVSMALLWLAALAWHLRAGPSDAVHRAAFLLAALLLVLPTVHPWYLLALLPLLCVHAWWGWLALTGTSALTWLAHQPTGGDERWTESVPLKLLEYAPLFLWLSWCAWRRLHPLPESRT